MIEKIVAICQSKEEANNWVDLLRQHTKGYHKTPPPVTIPDTAPTPPPHVSDMIFNTLLNILYTLIISLSNANEKWKFYYGICIVQ